MTVQESNQRFAQYTQRLQARVAGYAWVAFVWVVTLLNDRVLPQERAIDPEAVAAWCRQYLADRNPGPQQFRGAPMAAQTPITNPQGFQYRGLKVAGRPAIATSALARPEAPFVPFYQRRLTDWIQQSRWSDKDAVATAPEFVQGFRGRSL